ncbi:hypothetical protein NHH73_26250 [Oxalobacteraceae bacterium OTU3CINTB1]|nr:hypothetical protein NHH73_26250 [Oxalobacteraceae bacterium OTU3CINTB1]
MMKSIKIVLLFVLMSVFSGMAGAQALDTRFEGWLGKNQHGYYLDGSEWHYCFGNRGGSCGSVALTTGHSSCRTTGFNIGGKWAIPTRIGGMEVNASANRSWTACNIRSETITCTPNKGYKGRAVINFSERMGRIRVLGAQNYLSIDNDCPAGFRNDWLGGTSWRCTYVGGTYNVDGYLPEWRGSSCQYEKI